MNDKDVERICRKIKVENELDWLKTDIIAAEEAKARAIVTFRALSEWRWARERYEQSAKMTPEQKWQAMASEEEHKKLMLKFSLEHREQVNNVASKIAMRIENLPELRKPPKNSTGIKI